MLATLLRSRIITLGWGACCAALASLIVFWSLTLPAGMFDDGIQLTSAMFLLRGQEPNIDFYVVYPPFNAYLIAGAFRLFGESVVSYRIVQTAAYVVILLALWNLPQLVERRRRLPTLAAALAITAALAMLQSVTALAWSSLVVLALFRARAAQGRAQSAWLVAGGSALGALAMTRPNFALYLGAAWALDAGLALFGRVPTTDVRRVTREGLRLFVPALAVVLLVLWAWGGSPQELVRQVAIVPSKALIHHVIRAVPSQLDLAGLRTLMLNGTLASPLPTLWLAVRAARRAERAWAGALFAVSAATLLAALLVGFFAPALLPLLVVVQVVSCAVVHFRTRWMGQHESFLLLLLALQTHYTLSRTDAAHFYALLPVIVALLFVGQSAVDGRTWSLLLLLVAAICGPATLYNLRAVATGSLARRALAAELPTLLRSEDRALWGACREACDPLRYDAAEFAAVSYVAEHAAPDERVFSGVQHNDLRAYNAMRAYWLMRRPAGTRYVMMMGGVSTGREREHEIIADLERHRVRWLLLWASESTPESAAKADSILDDYVRERFVREFAQGDYEVWRRSEAQVKATASSP